MGLNANIGSVARPGMPMRLIEYSRANPNVAFCLSPNKSLALPAERFIEFLAAGDMYDQQIITEAQNLRRFDLATRTLDRSRETLSTLRKALNEDLSYSKVTFQFPEGAVTLKTLGELSLFANLRP
ncbi:hypothetical protein ACFL4F_03985, partial [Candidatus Margulisiibacteriota bacterium]